MDSYNPQAIETALRALVAQFVSFPAAQCCKHWAAASVLSAMERLGLPVTETLAEAVVTADDETALRLLGGAE